MKKIEIIESNNKYINNNILSGESLDLEELKK